MWNCAAWGVCEVAWCLGAFGALDNTFGDKDHRISWKSRWSPVVKAFPKALLSWSTRQLLRLVHRVFTVGILAKGLNGIVEILVGGFLLLVPPPTISQVIIFLTRHELIEDPHDLLANYLVRGARQLSVDTQWFGAVYLLSHGGSVSDVDIGDCNILRILGIKNHRIQI